MNGFGGRPGWAWIFILVRFGIYFNSLQFSTIPIGRIVHDSHRHYWFLLCAFYTTRLPIFNWIPERVSLWFTYRFPAHIDLTIFRLVMSRLEKDRPSITSAVKFSLKEVMRSVGSPHVIMVSIMIFVVGIMSYGLAIFLPSIVSQLGFSPNTTQLLSAGPFMAGFVGEYFKSTAHEGIFTAYSSSIFNFCILLGPLRIKGYNNYPRFHSRRCRFCSFSKWHGPVLDSYDSLLISGVNQVLKTNSRHMAHCTWWL